MGIPTTFLYLLTTIKWSLDVVELKKKVPTLLAKLHH
jgi:hypothetical protein